MSFTDVMYGNLGQVNNQFQANLGQNAAMNQQNQYAAQQAQASAAAQQAQLAALYGAQGFGGQTAYYAGQGAAYGRDTGGFGGYGGMNDPFSPVGGYNSMDAGAGYYSQPGTVGSDWPSSGGASGVGNDWPTYPGGGGGGMSFPAPQPQSQVDWAPYFNQLTAPQSPYSYNSGAVAQPDWMSIASGGGGGYYGQAGSVGNDWGGLGSIPSAAPNPYTTLGYDPSTLYQNAMSYPGGGVSSYFNPASYGGFGMGVPAATQYQPYQQQSAMPDWMSIASGGGGGGYYSQPGNVGNDWGGLMAADQSWLGAGGTQNPYNPFGQINAGQAGQYDPFGGYQPGADFNSRFGNIPGQPYGQGYFDQSFGAANSQPQAYNPFMGGYPGAMSSDNMANQQQMWIDLNKTLGIIDNAGEQYGPTYNPSGNTLRGQDFSPNWYQ